MIGTTKVITKVMRMKNADIIGSETTLTSLLFINEVKVNIHM